MKRIAVVADTGQLEREVKAFVERRARADERKPLSVAAREQYRNNLRLFVNWCATQSPPITSLADMDATTIKRYDAYLAKYRRPKTGKPLSIFSQRTYLRSVRAFLRASNVERDRDYRLPPEPQDGEFEPKTVLTPDEVELLIKTAGPGTRNALIIETLSVTGLRVGELLRLRGRDIIEDKHTRKGMIRVPGGKTGGRIIGIVPSVWRKLRRWADAHCDSDDALLFMGARRRPESGEYEALRVGGVEQAIRHIADTAGLGDRKITPHVFRHTLASRMVEKGANLVVLQHQLGHRDLSQISRTYAKVRPETMTDSLVAVFGK
jgi:integrase/recombinase XerD